MDHIVLTCYNWENIKLDHDFYQNERSQMRVAFSPAARRKVLHRLLLLNVAIIQQEASRFSTPGKDQKQKFPI